MKLKTTITFLFILLVASLHAQYINTDSLVFALGHEMPVTIKKAYKLEMNLAGPVYDKNLSGGNLLTQFSIPGDGKVISRFGPRSGRMHTGTDIKMQKGDTIYAAFNGEVNRANYYYGYGNLVVLQHEKDFETYYGHLSKCLVKNGDWVIKGGPIGLAGATGRATTSHLHFEIRESGKPYDAELVFDFENGRVRNEVENIENLAALHNELKPKGYTAHQAITQNYIVRSGDSLWKISKRAKTSINALCQLNDLNERTVLQVGQVLKVF